MPARIRPNPLFIAAALLVAVGLASGAQALTRAQSFEEIHPEDREALESLARHPGELRLAIFEASAHPDALMAITEIQSKSSRDFAALVEGLPRNDQEQLYELARYPDLVERLASGRRKTASQVDELVAGLPATAGSAARAVNEKHRSMLIEMIAIGSAAERAFERELEPLSETTRVAFERLIEHPDILMTLSERMHMTVVVGNAYREDPAAVIDEFASLHGTVVAREDAADREWADTVESDPEVRAELEASAEAYAEEYGSEDAHSHHHDHHHCSHPYGYWYGFPSWHGAYGYNSHHSYYSHIWFGLPLAYHLGFYYGPGHTFYISHRPTYYYWNWHDRHRRHYAPRLTRHFDRRAQQRGFRAYHDGRGPLRNGRHLKRDARRARHAGFVGRPTLESEVERRRAIGRGLRGVGPDRGERRNRGDIRGERDRRDRRAGNRDDTRERRRGRGGDGAGDRNVDQRRQRPDARGDRDRSTRDRKGSARREQVERRRQPTVDAGPPNSSGVDKRSNRGGDARSREIERRRERTRDSDSSKRGSRGFEKRERRPKSSAERQSRSGSRGNEVRKRRSGDSGRSPKMSRRSPNRGSKHSSQGSSSKGNGKRGKRSNDGSRRGGR